LTKYTDQLRRHVSFIWFSKTLLRYSQIWF